MHIRCAAVVVLMAATACGSSGGTGNNPTASPATAAASPSGSSSPTAGGTPGPASLVHCTLTVPAGDSLVIGTVVGDPTLWVRDIQDPANAHNLCKFDPAAANPQFVSGARVAYETAAGEIVEADLATGATTVAATFGTGFGPVQYAISPDGATVTYLDSNAWRMAGPSGNRVLTTLPAVPARDFNPDEDNSFLRFSPDGKYIALIQTLHTGGSGATAPDQVRKASDGSLVYSASGMTMGVWASVPSRLFFRDSTGKVRRWASTAGVSSMLSLRWIRPVASPDGRWIAYTYRTPGGLGTVDLYSVQSNTTTNASQAGRSEVKFLTNDLIWYAGERACLTCSGGLPAATGLTYIYDIAGGVEVISRLTGVTDAWPHSTPAGA